MDNCSFPTPLLAYARFIVFSNRFRSASASPVYFSKNAFRRSIIPFFLSRLDLSKGFVGGKIFWMPSRRVFSSPPWRALSRNFRLSSAFRSSCVINASRSASLHSRTWRCHSSATLAAALTFSIKPSISSFLLRSSMPASGDNAQPVRLAPA